MATGGHAPETDVLINLHQVLSEEETVSTAGQEDEEWEALSVERFGDIITESAINGADKMGRSYNEKDFEYHRHTFHHTHHPLSTHLPPQRFRKRVLSMDRRRKKKRKKKKTSMPPSDVTPTIHEVDEEEAESETEGQCQAVTPTEPSEELPQLSLGSEEDLAADLPLTSFHMESERPTSSEETPPSPAGTEEQEETPERPDGGEEEEVSNRFSPSPEPASMTTRGWFRRKPVHRLAGAQRTSYDLRERICIGSMTAIETAVYQKVPTDEAEAQMLASADLDDMKSHRFEDNPGVRRHLVKKSSRCQVPRTSNSSPLSSLKRRKRMDKKTHEVFVELNELIVDKNQEMRWKETARWIKFEEDVEAETDRWGKPHVASLSFRSLLELRRTITHEFNWTLNTVFVELNELIVDKNQEMRWKETARWIKFEEDVEAETDRWGKPHVASLSFRSLLELRRTITHVLSKSFLLSSHPNDEKEGLFHRNHSVNSLGGFRHNHNHVHDTSLPLVSQDHEEMHDSKAAEHDKEKSLHPVPAEGHAAARSMKLLAKIPKDAEATVVLVGCVEFLEKPAMAFVRLNEAVLLESVLEVPVPVRFIFVLLGPTQTNMDYHEIGRSFSTLMSDKNFHEVAYFADDRQDLLNGINEFLDCSIVIPPSDVEGKDLLKTVASFQKQMLRKRKERELKKCGSTVTGAELETKDVSTDEQDEEDQFDVDPLKRSGIPFGGLIHDIRRRYPRYISDLKDAMDTQCFAAVIFIYFAALSPTITFGGLLGEKTQGMMGVSELIISTATAPVLPSFKPIDPQGHSVIGKPILNQPNTALLSLVLMIGTFFVAFFLRKFRNSRFLGGKARRIIGDFGIPISILISVLVDCTIPDTYTQKLNVPSGFSVTSPDKRSWFVSPFGDKQPFPVWMMGASVIPALLVFILIFMETQITTLIVSKKERRLVKGSGFHLDLLLIVTLGAICPLFGLPWLTAATVRSVTHVNALTVMSKATAPGEKPMIQEVKEQRVTGMCVAILVGLSIVMTDVLRHIPLAVLFGIFLYMGITSLTGIQLYERITLMVTPAKHHPDHIYVTKVKTWRMNMFTIIQLLCIALLWVVKSTVASLAFPFILIMTVPLRRLILTRIFEERELAALDADEDSPNFDEDGRDEYNEIHMLV
ncbi:LOW QUALITY PROTEIN: anion exchange protein 3-like [Sinocyclocheilus grahami]|uniref:LOW QUALITY PROTEIN: anion exchange protein 3-like n=1 Tax=Sinocyclocheilus grahami TaxID=75366 RepID=UPI0007AD329E|nr:PREDICTED: LOW QUALITY PROTEIN: anion exchange protein 3-like [Sinocyclocheilus grahami]